MAAKEIIFDEEARKGLRDGVDALADAVKVTQNNPACIACGQTFARILEDIIINLKII